MTVSKEAREQITKEIVGAWVKEECLGGTCDEYDLCSVCEDKYELTKVIDKALASTPPTPPQPMGESGLLPCPHCGNKAEVKNTDHKYWNVRVMCGACCRCTDAYNHADHWEKMFADWNRRAPSPAPTDKEDSERLDWLEKHYLPVDEMSCRQTVKCGLLGVTFDAPYPNLRQAIDAARSKTPAPATQGQPQSEKTPT